MRVSFVAVWRTVMVAPGIVAPLESFTAPVNVASADCARMRSGANSRQIAATMPASFFISSLPNFNRLAASTRDTAHWYSVNRN